MVTRSEDLTHSRLRSGAGFFLSRELVTGWVVNGRGEHLFLRPVREVDFLLRHRRGRLRSYSFLTSRDVLQHLFLQNPVLINSLPSKAWGNKSSNGLQIMQEFLYEPVILPKVRAHFIVTKEFRHEIFIKGARKIFT